MDTETYERVFAKRAIDRKVAERRPHVPYDCGDVAAVLAADPGWNDKKGSLRNVVRQSSGVAMLRHPAIEPDPAEVAQGGFPEFRARRMSRSILAELRPDEPILVQEEFPHKHPATASPTDPPWVADHLERRERLVEKKKTLDLQDFDRAHGPRTLNGEIVGPEVSHAHAHTAKYVFPPGNNQGKRLDAHPDAHEMIDDTCRRGGVLFYALEGCLKADAILSAGRAVVSVPSVVLYWPQEMQLFIERYLGGTVSPKHSRNPTTRFDGRPSVVLLTDSDWRTNTEVMFYGVETAGRLRQHGVNAIFAAPPVMDDDPKTGVDDYLYAGGRLDDLPTVEHLVRPEDDLQDLVASRLHRGCGVSVKTGAEVFRWLLLHATPEGEVLGKVKRCARSLYPDLKPEAALQKVNRARAAFREAGLIHQREPLRRIRRYGSSEWKILAPKDLILPDDLLVTVRSSETVSETLRDR
jgi:hypothetical protein